MNFGAGFCIGTGRCALITIALQLLDEGAATLVLNVVECGKIGKTLMVVFENGGRLDPLDAILGKVRRHLVDDHRRNALVLIVGTNSNDQ